MSVITVLVLGVLAVSATAVPRHGRVVSGIPAGPDTVPHQARVYVGDDVNNGFGGTLIKDDWVITAASRTHLHDAVDLTVFVGETVKSVPSPTRHTSLVSKKVEHPRFVPTIPTANDLALLQLATAAVISANLKPAIIPTRSDEYNDFVGHDSIISGWGPLIDGGEAQDRLYYGHVTVINNYECMTHYEGHVGILETHICAKGPATTCEGDEGGPLVEALGAGEYKLIGVSSFHSYYGCVSETPAGFIRVSRYLDWISETAGILIHQ